MVDGDSSDRALRDVRTLKAVNEAHDIIRASGGLPVVKAFRSHVWKMHCDPGSCEDFGYDLRPGGFISIRGLFLGEFGEWGGKSE